MARIGMTSQYWRDEEFEQAREHISAAWDDAKPKITKKTKVKVKKELTKYDIERIEKAEAKRARKSKN